MVSDGTGLGLDWLFCDLGRDGLPAVEAGENAMNNLMLFGFVAITFLVVWAIMDMRRFER